MQVTRSRFGATRKTITALLLAGMSMTALLPVPAAAQDDARLRKIESELKALQRAVFPGGDGRYFAPEVDTATPQQARPSSSTAPSGSALTDVLQRLDSLEAQLARLTARSEENANHLAQLEAQLKAVQESAAAPEQASLTPSTPAMQGGGPRPGASAPASTPPRAGTLTPTPAPAAAAGRPATQPAGNTSRTPTATPTPATAASGNRNGPSAGRLAAVRAITKPTTADAGEDEYNYGYRLWEAGFFPEAQQQLALYVEKYPRHARISFGRNLLGRAYLDNGQPREAATHFFENYQSDKQGARAGDSLLFLSESMIAINDKNRACIALAEFSDSYPALATGRLKEQYDRTKNKVSCS
jgi:TolA-binding protein